MKNNEKNIRNNPIEIRCEATEIRLAQAAGQGDNKAASRTIEGYAAKFDRWSDPIHGWFREKVDSRAFDGCDMKDVVMTFNHDVCSILARTGSGTLSLSTDETGLRFRFDAPETTLGNDMLELVRRGDISKCSFAFVVDNEEWRYADKENGLELDERTILHISVLRDVSLVVFPAYPDTEAGIRALEQRKADYLKSHAGHTVQQPEQTKPSAPETRNHQPKPNTLMSRLKQLKEQRASVFSRIDELRTSTDGREMTAEERQQWDSLMAEYTKADKAVEDEERYEQMQRRQAEQQFETKSNAMTAEQQTAEEYRAAFTDYLLHGAGGVSAESRAVLEKRASITGLTGGVIIPTTLASQIEIALKTYGGMFEAGSIINTSNGGDLVLPTINDTAAKASIVAEYAQSTKRAPSFGSVTIKAYTYRTPIIPVSLELLQDSAFNLDSLLSGLLADSFGRGINEHLTVGTGTGQPKGIVTCATACDNKAAATAISLDNLLDLIASVDNAYAKNGRFMFSRNTLFALAKIKDTDGKYIWQDGARVGASSTIFGKPYIINDDMADIAAGASSVLFGDLGKYRIRMVSDFKVVRLNELLAEYLSIGLFGFARADGILLDAGTHPVKKLVHATA